MKKWTLTRTIATVGCLLAAVSLAVFLVLASDRTEDANIDSAYQFENARIVAPKTYGSYGELMFAYVGENNYLYNLDDESTPLIYQPVKELLYASDDSVLYTASCELSSSHLGRESIIQELQVGEKENRVNTIARVTIDPCWSSNDEVIYYVEDESKNQLCTFEPLTSTSEIAATFERDIACLRISSDGLLVTLVDGVEMLYVPLSKQLTDPGISTQNCIITVCEQYDLLLSADGILSYHWQGADELVQIAEDVLIGISHQDNEIYYIRQSAGRTDLMCYIVSDEQQQTLVSLDSSIMPQLTSDADYAFVLTEHGIVYRYDIQENELIPYHFIDMESVKAPMISLFDYRLMVYDLAKEPDESFCYSIPSGSILTSEEVENLIEQAKDLTIEASNLNSSAEYTFLSMGSTGEKVLALQSALNARGYLPVQPTGIYGYETMTAVFAAQADMDLPETGFADQLFQTLFMNSDTVYQIHPITEKNSGIAERNLHARLISLGYLLHSNSEELDSALRNGITLFCIQNNIQFEGVISENIQSAVFSKDAMPYGGHLELKKDDKGDACSKINGRLFELGYSQYSPRPVVDEYTIDAIRLFSTVNNMEFGSTITAEIQEKLESSDAISCPVELMPEPLIDTNSDTKGQVITDKELKMLRKWLTKSFAVNHTDKQAVKRLQVRLVRLGYLGLGDITMIFDDATSKAVFQFQAEHELTPNGIPSKKTLMLVFGITNSTLSGE